MGTLVRLKEYLTRSDELEEGQYACLSCYETFEYQQQVCPECGGYDIRATEWLDDQLEEQSVAEDA